jgi:hypothetical protein
MTLGTLRDLAAVLAAIGVAPGFVGLDDRLNVLRGDGNDLAVTRACRPIEKKPRAHQYASSDSSVTVNTSCAAGV